MKRKVFSLFFVVLFSFAYTSCREKTPGEKIEDGVEEVGDGLKDAVD